MKIVMGRKPIPRTIPARMLKYVVSCTMYALYEILSLLTFSVVQMTRANIPRKVIAMMNCKISLPRI